MKAAKEASAALLAGEKIGFYSEFPWEGDLPDGLMLCGKDGIPSVTGQMDESAGGSAGNRHCGHFAQRLSAIFQYCACSSPGGSSWHGVPEGKGCCINSKRSDRMPAGSRSL